MKEEEVEPKEEFEPSFEQESLDYEQTLDGQEENHADVVPLDQPTDGDSSQEAPPNSNNNSGCGSKESL